MSDTRKLVPNMNFLMEQKSINIKELAELSNISVTTLRAILSGRRKGTVEQLVKISKGLNVTMQDLITRDLSESIQESGNSDQINREKAREELINEIRELRSCDVEFLIKFIKDMYKIGK